MTRTFVHLVIGSSVAFAIGCGGPEQPAQSPAGGSDADGGLASLTNESTKTVSHITNGAANAPEMALQPAGSSTGDAIQTNIRTIAAVAAPGMTPDGPMGRADLKQGGHATMSISLKPGHCYAVVGFGSGISDLDLHVLTPPNYDVVAYEDATDDNAPTAGKAPHAICPTAAVDLPYKVDAYAETGGGSIGVQLYSKTQ